MSLASELKKDKNKQHIAVIGDGSMTGGIAFEGLNHAGMENTNLLIMDEVFDSSLDRGEPATFPINRVIPGWSEGVKLMVVGDKWKITIPSALAYGEAGMPQANIPPNADIIFIVELLGIE